MAVAVKDIPASEFNPVGDLMPWVRDLTLAGLVGIIDPPRPEARERIRLCQQAGITVKMITGDHPSPPPRSPASWGWRAKRLTGAEIDAMPADELGARIERLAVFARVAPEHKVRIVQALQDHGHVVAVTGDGVNDAPALKARRHRRGHGHDRDRRSQGSRHHGAHRRQLCDHRAAPSRKGAPSTTILSGS